MMVKIPPHIHPYKGKAAFDEVWMRWFFNRQHFTTHFKRAVNWAKEHDCYHNREPYSNLMFRNEIK